MIGFIVFLLVLGLVVGAVARAIVPGSDPLGIGGTILTAPPKPPASSDRSWAP
jgi:uncharacterized membrane protein YeaQ/YmgE (transglycosylase-associated protein family)